MTAFWCLQVNGGHSPRVYAPAPHARLGIVIGDTISAWICIAIGAGVRIDIRLGSVVSIRIWIGLNIASIDHTQYPKS